MSNRFWWSDTTLCIGTAVMSDRAVYTALLNKLRRHGFRIAQDKKVSRIIRRDYHVGGRGDLMMHSHHYPTGAQISFFQEIVKSNPNGGRYDFDREKKMPYAIRLRFHLERRFLERYLESKGFVNTTKPALRVASEIVEYRRQEIRQMHGQNFYEGPRQPYNATDADGRQLSDGDTRYFYTYGGSLRRGTVYHNLNNMWWVVVSRHEYHNEACFRLFEYDPTKHSARKPVDPVASVKRKLNTAVREQHFERAIGLRDALKRLTA